MSNDKVEQLIELFHEEACLWDVNDMNYMNADSRQPTAGCIKSGFAVKNAIIITGNGYLCIARPSQRCRN
jgi:hypothetical protein